MKRTEKSVLIMAARGADSIPEHLRRRIERNAQVRYLKITEPLSADDFVAVAQNFHYLAITRRAICRLDAPTIRRLKNLKGLSVYSTGLEWLDETALRRQGIGLASLPGYCTNAVAEAALGMVLMSAHKLHLRYLKSTRRVPECVSLRGGELASSSVGIIGNGRIGSLLARKLRPLCASVLQHDSQAHRSHATLSAVLQKSKFILCCASQCYETQQIFGEHHYRLLKPDSVLINIGRTSLFNHALLCRMVRDHQLGAYFYDDLMQSPEETDQEDYGRLCPMGHSAWYTDEALENGVHDWMEGLENLMPTQPVFSPDLMKTTLKVRQYAAG